MDLLVEQLFSFPSETNTTDEQYDKEAKAFIGILNKTGASSLLQRLPSGDDLLDVSLPMPMGQVYISEG